MGRVIACGIPQGAGLNRTPKYQREQDKKAAEGDEPAEYRREQN